MAIQFISDQNLEEQFSQYKLPVLVTFWASWWEDCIEFEPVLDELENKYKDKVLFFKIDTDKYREAFVQYEFFTTPTLVFFRNGKPVAQYASGDYRTPYNFIAVADFIQECLDHTLVLDALNEIQLDETKSNINSIRTTAQLFDKDVIQQELPVFLFSYWSHKQHVLAPKIEHAFDQLSSLFIDKYKFVKLDRTDPSKEMEKIDELYELNFLSGEPAPYPAVYVFMDGQKTYSTIDGEENAWFYFQNTVDEFPIEKLLSILIHKLETKG